MEEVRPLFSFMEHGFSNVAIFPGRKKAGGENDEDEREKKVPENQSGRSQRSVPLKNIGAGVVRYHPKL